MWFIFSPHGLKRMQAHQAKSVDVEWNEDLWKQWINAEEDFKKAELSFRKWWNAIAERVSRCHGFQSLPTDWILSGGPWWFLKAQCWRWAWAQWETVLWWISNVCPGEEEEMRACSTYASLYFSANTFYKGMNGDLRREVTFPRIISKS